jgi:hypothetical protein
MSSIDIEYQIEGRFVTALQAVFAFDDKFIYNEDDKITKVKITPDYPEDNTPIEIPHLVVTNIGYEFNLDTSINRNFFGDVFENNVFVGSKHANIIPYSLKILCLAELFESKDLANKVAKYISFDASEAFDTIGLYVTRVTKGLSSPQQQFPQKVFQTPVAVVGNLHWVGTKTETIDMSKVLQKINSNMQIYLNK